MDGNFSAVEKTSGSDAVDTRADRSDATSLTSALRDTFCDVFAEPWVANADAASNDHRVALGSVFQGRLPLELDTRFGGKLLRRGADRADFVTRNPATVAVIKAGSAERLTRPDQVQCSDSVEADETYSFGCHAERRFFHISERLRATLRPRLCRG